MTIQETRKELLSKRESLSAQQIKEASLRMADDLLKDPHFQESDTIYVYWPVHNELDTNYLVTKAIQLGKTVAFPVVLSKGDMVFEQIDDPIRFHENRYRIMEPVYDPKAVIDRPGLMIVPIVGFCGNKRIGYGSQYYNNYLKWRKNVYTIGVAYSFQELSELAEDERDIPLDEIRTY